MSNVLQLDREKLLGRIGELEAENRLIMDKGSAAVIAELRAENQRLRDRIADWEYAIDKLEAENQRLKKDQQRLEFVINNGALMQCEGDPCESYSISYFEPTCDSPFGSETGYHSNWRDAIDEAMGKDSDE